MGQKLFDPQWPTVAHPTCNCCNMITLRQSKMASEHVLLTDFTIFLNQWDFPLISKMVFLWFFPTFMRFPPNRAMFDVVRWLSVRLAAIPFAATVQVEWGWSPVVSVGPKMSHGFVLGVMFF